MKTVVKSAPLFSLFFPNCWYSFPDIPIMYQPFVMNTFLCWEYPGTQVSTTMLNTLPNSNFQWMKKCSCHAPAIMLLPMYRLWLHGLHELNGPRCPLSPERLLNLITLTHTALNSPVIQLDTSKYGSFYPEYILYVISISMSPTIIKYIIMVSLFGIINHSLLCLIHWGLDKMAAFLQTTFSNACS